MNRLWEVPGGFRLMAAAAAAAAAAVATVKSLQPCIVGCLHYGLHGDDSVTTEEIIFA